MVRIQVLGPFRVVDDSNAVLAFRTRSAASILAYLAIRKGGPISRHEMSETLWPDQYSHAARTALRTALYRARTALGGCDPIVSEGDTLQMDSRLATTDLMEVDDYQRTYALSPEQGEGLEALEMEWTLRRRELLQGWDFSWIEPYRQRSWHQGNETALMLAQAHEQAGDPQSALRIFHELLDRVPHHAIALKQALRLEFQVHGKAEAMALAKRTTDLFAVKSSIEMPKELQRTLKEVKAGLLEPNAQPEFVKKRSELYLLARMFEANLVANRTEALAMLASECSVPTALAHPRAMASLLNLALSKTSGDSPERLQVASQATMLGSLTSDFEMGHRWADFVLSHASPASMIYGDILGIKGFMYFEQRNYELARTYIERSIDTFAGQGRFVDEQRAYSRLAGLDWQHQLRFDEARVIYERILKMTEGGESADDITMRSMAHGNLSFVHASTQQWEQAVFHGDCCVAVQERPLYGSIARGPYGLALFASGQVAKGLFELAKGVSATAREGMLRFNQITLDYAAIVLWLSGRQESAQALVHAATEHRAKIQHFRSQAETHVIVSNTDLDLSASCSGPNLLLGQTMGTLSGWACDELERAGTV
jgi:DNA-binding SARP family transcriptional activator